MKLDRASIVRTDFPAGKRGYDQVAVDRHLEAIAAAAAEQAPPSAAASISGTVQGVIEAAEAAAMQIEREARDQATQIRNEAIARAQQDAERIAGSSYALVARIEAIETELQAFFDDLHTRGTAIGAAMAALENDVHAQEQLEFDDQPLPAAPPIVTARVEPDDRPVVPREPAGVAPPVAHQSELPDGPAALEDARLVALDMALEGRDRAEIDAYLAAHFELDDRGALLDDVLAAVGG